MAALAVAFAAAACATPGLPPPAPSAFDLSGRVLVGYDGRAFSSGLRWQHVPHRDEIWLLTPLGQALGWELPLTRLQYWVRGEVAPGSAPRNVQRDPEGRLTGLVQDEWHITLEYPEGEFRRLPRRVELRRANESIRLVIDAWRSEPTAAP